MKSMKEINNVIFLIPVFLICLQIDAGAVDSLKIAPLKQIACGDIRSIGISMDQDKGGAGIAVSIIQDNALISISGKDDNLAELTSNLAQDERAISSPDGHFVVINKYGPEGLIKHISVINQQHAVVWEKETPFLKGIVGISNGGGTLVAIKSEGSPEDIRAEMELIFYDGRGNEMGKTRINAPKLPMLSSDGTRLVSATYYDSILVYNNHADLLWKMGAPCRDLSISKDAQIIGICNKNSFSIYLNGDLLTTTEREEPLRYIMVSKDGKFALVSSLHNLYYYDIGAQKLLWENKLASEQQYINSISLSGNGDLISCGIQKDSGQDHNKDHRYLRGYICILKKDGEIQWQKDFEYSRSNGWTPAVMISEGSDLTVVLTRDTLYVYRISGN